MSETNTILDSVRLAVIVSDFGAAANLGAGVETRVRVFDLPQEIVDYIASSKGEWTTVSLATV